MKERTIFHIDINHCYAQIEEMEHPELRKIPMAVGGHEEKRHGIILAKNDLAKKEGILTGESLREAREKDPDLLIIPPDYEAYIYYTGLVKKIYRRYSDHVESFGLDEAWIDYTDSISLYGDPIARAYAIQKEVLEETGLTVSVGVSWNKAFAKLGSDLKKPYGMTIITKENYKDLIWPLPVSDLLYVGPATEKKLRERAIYTIGGLANYSVKNLRKYLGIPGEVIWNFANGYDPSPVEENAWRPAVKSVGNSMTLVHDVHTMEETEMVMRVIAESVAARLRDEGMEGNTVTVFLRSSGLGWYSMQHKRAERTDVSTEILDEAMNLVKQCYDFSMPLRACGLSVSGLKPWKNIRQLSLFENACMHEKERTIDIAVENLRSRYGPYIIRKASMYVDKPLTEFDPKQDHTVHPTGYFQGRRMKQNAL